ncbi:unnamed protein product [Linum tenue]|uniref:Uncharacterized protein n=1 Tax=Linum tenue TaxID=586396 RepID=A0AAV0P937_9ROSI|nr:unnamed protein product [Linum tenue]
MAASISKGILRSFGSLSALRRCQDVSIRASGDSSFSRASSFHLGSATTLSHQRWFTSVLTPESSDGPFPADLLSSRAVITPDRKIGMEAVL